MRTFLIILSLSILITMQSFAQHSEFNFSTKSWKEVKKLAKKSAKPIFVQAMANNCSACDELEGEVLSDKELAAIYNESFILFRLDANTKDQSKIEKGLSISAYPTSLFVDANGKVIHKYVGYITNVELVDMAKRVLAKTATLSYYNNLYKSNPSALSSDKLFDYAKILYHASMNYDEVANAYFAQQSDEKLGSPQNIYAIILFTDDIDSREFLFLVRRNSNMTFDENNGARVQLKVEDVISNVIVDYAQQVKDVRLLKDSLNKIFDKYEVQKRDLVYSRVVMDYFDYIKPDNHAYFIALVDYMNSHIPIMTASQIADKCKRVIKDCRDRDIMEMSIQWIMLAIDKDPRNVDSYRIDIDLLLKMKRYGEAHDIARRMIENCGDKLDNPDETLRNIDSKIEAAMNGEKR